MSDILDVPKSRVRQIGSGALAHARGVCALLVPKFSNYEQKHCRELHQRRLTARPGTFRAIGSTGDVIWLKHLKNFQRAPFRV